MLCKLFVLVLFVHETVESLLRELRRNKQLRTICGFELRAAKQKDGSIKIYVAPSASTYSKFLKNLMSCQDELDGMFTELVLYMYRNLEHFGEILMMDGKAIQSFGTKPSINKKSRARGEHDADWCKKQYSADGPNGESVIKTKKCFGFRLHLIADAIYEMPVAFTVTKASNSEQTEARGQMKKIEKEHKEWMERKGITLVIDIRNCWKEGEETHQYRDTNLVYNYKGTVWYVEGI